MACETVKLKISVALAEEGRQGEVRFLGDIDNTPDAMKRLVRKLSGKYLQLLFCYEAGPTGYGLHRQITALGHDCSVIAPSLIPSGLVSTSRLIAGMPSLWHDFTAPAS